MFDIHLVKWIRVSRDSVFLFFFTGRTVETKIDFFDLKIRDSKENNKLPNTRYSIRFVLLLLLLLLFRCSLIQRPLNLFPEHYINTSCNAKCPKRVHNRVSIIETLYPRWSKNVDPFFGEFFQFSEGCQQVSHSIRWSWGWVW